MDRKYPLYPNLILNVGGSCALQGVICSLARSQEIDHFVKNANVENEDGRMGIGKEFIKALRPKLDAIKLGQRVQIEDLGEILGVEMAPETQEGGFPEEFFRQVAARFRAVGKAELMSSVTENGFKCPKHPDLNDVMPRARESIFELDLKETVCSAQEALNDEFKGKTSWKKCEACGEINSKIKRFFSPPPILLAIKPISKGPVRCPFELTLYGKWFVNAAYSANDYKYVLLTQVFVDPKDEGHVLNMYYHTDDKGVTKLRQISNDELIDNYETDNAGTPLLKKNDLFIYGRVN